METEKRTEEEVYLESDTAVFEIPKHTVGLKIEVTVFENGELCRVARELSMDEVREAVRKAEEWYLDPDTTFTLTDKGRALFEELAAAETCSGE